jgi:ESF2/ABP1 family protein
MMKIHFYFRWVEFTDKKVAKTVSLSLNCTKMVSKKRGFYSEDLWNIQYLPQFKWDNLTEKLAYDQRIRKEKIKAELAQEKKKQEFYLEKLDLSKKILAMENRKKEKLEENKEGTTKPKQKGIVRKFKQHEVVEKKLSLKKKIKKLKKIKMTN